MSEAAFYRWKKVCAGMGMAEIRRSKQLEERARERHRCERAGEHGKLKRLAADLSLDKEMVSG